MEQLTIFDVIKNKQIEDIGILSELEEVKKQYLIDNHYKIARSLMKFNRFPEYISKVYEILEKHYDVIDSKIGGFDVIGIEKQDNCIIIYQPRMQYSIWCISMLDSEFYKYAK